ncbi:hypothetical protein BD410DRAFT_844250 [Rickenella mellea]|uniref:F-box domain-containing protein n=1 Tax=Rickenella mellea TaxID=50990 RepID=A0A4Y7PML6_9AGAM|nr:hypothetical protein BD410DRAFT_844250 [Rickenella mellea]
MSRSHQQDLQLTCKNVAVGDEGYFKTFFNSLLPQSIRWTYLHIDKRLLQFIPSNLPLIRVHSLVLNHVQDSFQGGLCAIPPIFPNLRVFGGANAIPMFTTYPSSLTTCVLSWHGMRLRVIPLLTCLAHLVSVRTLTLCIGDDYPSDLPQDSPTPTHTLLCTMPNVVTVSVRFDGEFKWRIVKGIFSFLVLPKLDDATISFRKCTTADGLLDVLEVLRRLVRLSNRPFQNVHTLCVDVVECEDSSVREADILKLLLEPLPTVRDLTINIPTAEFAGSCVVQSDGDSATRPTEVTRNQFSSLETLRLINCHHLTERKLRALAKNLWNNTPSNGLQLLEVIECREISEVFLLELSSIMGDSLKWNFPSWRRRKESSDDDCITASSRTQKAS